MKKVCDLNRIASFLAVSIVLSLALCETVYAHRVNIFAWAEGDTVFVECKFPDGRRVNEGTIRVLDPAGAELLSGQTNDQGEFSFKIPKQTDMTVVLEASMGHRAEWKIPAEELSAAGQPAATAAPVQQAAGAELSAPPAGAAEGEASAIPSQDIQQALERALDKKLAPVLKMLAESREQGPKVSDVLGGLGYIVGVAGIAAYFKRPSKGKT
jgi:nickel transport protein